MDELSFHEATVVALSKRNERVSIELSDVTYRAEKTRATIEVWNVSKVITDGETTDDLFMVRDDGEVLTLEFTAQAIHMIVQWNDFVRRESLVRSYRIEGREVNVRLG